MFFTLTFAQDQAPDETQAHRALRSLVRRLRYRDLLGAYGWVLHRQKNGTLHYHGIAHLRWMDDGLALWRELIQASGFGVQNKLLVAQPRDAQYCTRYLSQRLATLAPLRRAYSFSRDFPESAYERAKREEREADALLAEVLGARPLCEWVPTSQIRAALR